MEEKSVDLFCLRVLMEYDETYKIFVARCLQTGSVATADDLDTVRDIMKELLEDEISHAVERRDLTDLFSSPAPTEVWTKWREAALVNDPVTIRLFDDMPERKTVGREKTSASVELASAA